MPTSVTVVAHHRRWNSFSFNGLVEIYRTVLDGKLGDFTGLDFLLITLPMPVDFLIQMTLSKQLI